MHITDETKSTISRAVHRIDEFMRKDILITLSDGRQHLEPQSDWSDCIKACRQITDLQLLLTDHQAELADKLITETERHLNSIATYVRYIATLHRPYENEAELLVEMNKLLNTAQKDTRLIGRELLNSIGTDSNESTSALKSHSNSSSSVDVFLSYCTRDTSTAENMASKLRQHNIRVFLAHQTISIGPRWELQVLEAAQACRLAVLLVSPQSLVSDWVRYEIGAFWGLGKHVAPVLMDVQVHQLPELIRQYQSSSIIGSADIDGFCIKVQSMLNQI